MTQENLKNKYGCFLSPSDWQGIIKWQVRDERKAIRGMREKIKRGETLKAVIKF